MAEDIRKLSDRYSVIELIGQGGMSIVYKGLDTKLGRNVAIKILKPELLSDTNFKYRFKKEANSVSKLNHNSIVRVLDAGEDIIKTSNHEAKILPYIVMEYISGINLKTEIKKRKFSSDEASMIMLELLSALEYSHNSGIIHRDIKPGNIMINDSGEIKVMDFGIARVVSDTSASISHTNSVLGTASYFSPEQAKGEIVDIRTDLYSAGIVFFELLTGTTPFKGDSAVAIAYQHVSEKPPKPSDINSDISYAFETVLYKSLMKQKNKRFQTAKEFSDAIKNALLDIPVTDIDKENKSIEIPSNKSIEISSNKNNIKKITTLFLSLILITPIVGFIMWNINSMPKESKEKTQIEIPLLKNNLEKEAVNKLNSLDLIVQRISENSEVIESGKVIKTIPNWGEKVNKNSIIKIYVSSGPEEVMIPDISNLNIEEAEKILESKNLQIGLLNYVDSKNLENNTILSTEPSAYKKVPIKSLINITVSNGKVTIPEVKGQSLEVAKSILEDLSIIVITIPNQNCLWAPGAPVINQSSIGSQPQKSTIEIGYCAG